MFICTSSICITILLVYVDDIIITLADSSSICELQKPLDASFHMKDLGSLTYFLDQEVHRSSKGLSINQHKYAKDLIAMAQGKNIPLLWTLTWNLVSSINKMETFLIPWVLNN